VRCRSKLSIFWIRHRCVAFLRLAGDPSQIFFGEQRRRSAPTGRWRGHDDRRGVGNRGSRVDPIGLRPDFYWDTRHAQQGGVHVGPDCRVGMYARSHLNQYGCAALTILRPRVRSLASRMDRERATQGSIGDFAILGAREPARRDRSVRSRTSSRRDNDRDT
jgi:hypothetical protein